MVGMSPGNAPLCPGNSHNIPTYDESHHPGVLRVGEGAATLPPLPPEVPTLPGHFEHHAATGQHGVPVVDQLASRPQVDMNCPVLDVTENEPPHPLVGIEKLLPCLRMNCYLLPKVYIIPPSGTGLCL